MANKNTGKNLPRLISGIWLLNLLGVAGLIAYIGFTRNPPPTQTISPATLTPTASETPVLANFFPAPPELTALPSVQPTLEIKKLLPSATPTLDPKGPAVIGYSVAGRPLEVYRFGDGPTGRLIVAGIHGGNEWNTIALAQELIDYIKGHPESIPRGVTLYILPDLNPDGEARIHGLDGRVNDHGVDLNRNWPYRWVKDFVRSNCWDYRATTAGDSAASEPETVALLTFIVKHPEIDALISYHAAALGIFAGGIPTFKPSVQLAEGLAKVSTYQFPPKDIGCIYTGDLTDWASSVQGMAAVDIELHNFENTDFNENLKILKVFLNYKKK